MKKKSIKKLSNKFEGDLHRNPEYLTLGNQVSSGIFTGILEGLSEFLKDTIEEKVNKLFYLEDFEEDSE